MAIALTYKADLSEAIELFGDLSAADTFPLVDEIGTHLVNATLVRFDQETSPDGTPWTPSQRALREGGKTLQDHGHLRDSYTHIVQSDSAVDIGSNSVYAAIHHEGGFAGRNRSVEIESRKALGVSADDEREIGEIVIDFYRGYFQ